MKNSRVERKTLNKQTNKTNSGVATHNEKDTHFDIFCQSVLNVGPNQQILKKKIK